ncbi:MAG: DUF1549 domain-containing protein [Verrucomicrobia bacterium]|nr:DUF1549 domain-containing protein [Verrucomicrobiota bacterium]
MGLTQESVCQRRTGSSLPLLHQLAADSEAGKMPALLSTRHPHSLPIRWHSRLAVSKLKGVSPFARCQPGKEDLSQAMSARNRIDGRVSSQLPARFLLLFGILPAVISIGSAFASETQVPMHERRNHWAYQPVQTGAVPSVKNPAWCADEIDAFILAKLEGNGLVPAAPADRRTLIRRATYDLLGLPPTPEETDDFLRDASPDAFAKAVDRLLASPRYGERWARHWLDLVRFSETLGFEFDFDLYHSWRYRDYVIRAFNSDLPYNRFVLEHLAGDLVADPRREPVEGYDESIIATGFFWMGEGRQTPVDIRQEQADVVDGQIDVLGKAFLGQTIACARCHDHKFDAISTQDYYALAGYLKSSRFQQAFIDPPDRITAKARQLEMLKTRIRQRITDEVAVTWIEEATHASRYLLAVQKVMNAARTAGTPALQPASGDVSDPRVPALGDKNALEPADRSVGITAATPAPLSSLKPRAKEVAPEFGLDEVRLERWIKALEQPELMEAEHPLYAWARLGNQVDEVDNPFSKRRQDLLLALHNQERRAALGAESVCTFERFDKTSFDGWHTTGTAFVSGPAQPGDFLLGDRHHHPVAQFVSRGAHSALLSRRLQGELRSETFTITRPYVHCLVAGQRSRLNLIIDGYLLLMNPMYGGLTVAPTNDLPSWRTIAVDRWIGHRAYFEISDSSLPTYRLNPPPSTGRVPEGPTDGYIEVRQICFSDERTPPPAPPNRVNLLALEQALGDNAQALAAAYETLIVQQLGAWRTGGQSPSNDLSEHGVALLNWLVENGLLDIPAPTLHEPPGRSRRRTEADQLKSKIQNPKFISWQRCWTNTARSRPLSLPRSAPRLLRTELARTNSFSSVEITRLPENAWRDGRQR